MQMVNFKQKKKTFQGNSVFYYIEEINTPKP